MIKIEIHSEWITLGQFLKFSGIIYSGGEVKNFLENNKVMVNDIEEKRRGKKLFSGDLIVVNGKKYIVKRENDN